MVISLMKKQSKSKRWKVYNDENLEEVKKRLNYV